MPTTHRILFSDSTDLAQIPAGSVELVVTSPPYPLIAMWDGIFTAQDQQIGEALAREDGGGAFALMHQVLDRVWSEVGRVLVPGGIACINVGDATRTVNGVFQVFPNHARIIQSFTRLGLLMLPEILWRKPTNAPTKFMGSGMLPPGAYVTQEHEYILTFRKGDKRKFTTAAARQNRQSSAYFWEERNSWFSDIWEIRGTNQQLAVADSRSRSAAYPLDIPYRLINMYSVQGDTVLDPFLGTGTTTIAAIASQRNSIGVELDPVLRESLLLNIKNSLPLVNTYIQERFNRHRGFADQRGQEKGSPQYHNIPHGVPVVTSQEVNLKLKKVQTISIHSPDTLVTEYTDLG